MPLGSGWVGMGVKLGRGQGLGAGVLGERSIPGLDGLQGDAYVIGGSSQCVGFFIKIRVWKFTFLRCPIFLKKCWPY